MRGHRFPNRFSKKEYPIAEAAPVGGAAFSYARRQPNPGAARSDPVCPRVGLYTAGWGNYPNPTASTAVGPLCRACAEGKNSLTKAEVEGRYSSRIKRGGQAPSPARLTPPRNAGRGNISAGVRISPLGSAWGSGGRKSPVWSHLYGFQAGIWRKEGDLQCQEKRSNLPCVFPRRRRNS